MNQPSGSVDAPPRSGTNIVFLIAGLAQILAAFTPAGHARLLGAISFIRLPQAGIAFVVLGALTVLVAVRPRGWWRWIPGLASAALLAVVYARLRWQPTGGFADPLVRRMVRPAWGFYPMGSAIFVALAMAASIPLLYRSRPAPVQPLPTPEPASETPAPAEPIAASDPVAEPIATSDVASEKTDPVEPVPASDPASETPEIHSPPAGSGDAV
jgi:hypothetical protein